MEEKKAGRRVEPNDIVLVHYTGRLKDGLEFDSSLGGEPFQFQVGCGEVIPGFDEAVIGMAEGEHKTAVIPPEEAFGPYNEDLVAELDRRLFDESFELEIGRQLVFRPKDGRPIQVTITDITEDTVTVDANHPLAGQEIIFEIELVKIL